jgi:hypothetical protein
MEHFYLRIMGDAARGLHIDLSPFQRYLPETNLGIKNIAI